MIRANFRKNSNENGHEYVRIQFYSSRQGTYMTNEMLRVKYVLDGCFIVDKKSIQNSVHFKKGESFYEVRSHLRKVMNNPKALVVFVNPG